MKDSDCFLFPYMVFVGKNNSGKSNLMKALDVFFHNSPTLEDFRIEKGKRITKFQIILTFVDLSATEQILFQSYDVKGVEPSSKIIICFTATLKGHEISTKYHFAYNGFDYSIPEIKNEYGFLDDEKLSSKSKIQKSSTVPQEFKDYLDDFCRCLPKGEKFSKSHLLQVKRDYISQKIKEENIPSKIKWAPLSIRKNEFSRYFGHYFFIPAVQDITKETTFAARSSSNLTKLMKYIFEKMQNQERQQRYEQNIRKIIQEIYRIDQPNSEIYKLQTSINSLLSDFDGSKIRFDTELPSIDKVVRDSLKIFIDDGVETEVMHKGHGLQRYFMVILFKAWANRIIPKSKEPPTSLIKENSFPISSSSVFFAVEEPELFLHPQYQRLMKHYLKNIAENPDNQVIFKHTFY